GTTQSGTPARRAFWVMPMPPWQTTAAARASTGLCGTNRRRVAFGGGENASGSRDAVVTTTSYGSPASASSAVLISLASSWKIVEIVTRMTGRRSSDSQATSPASGSGSQTPGPTSRTDGGSWVLGYSSGS